MNDENQLLKRLWEGDRTAFREFVDVYRKPVYFLALELTGNHHDAEDLAQEVFIKAYKNISKFRGDSKLSSWLYRITVNKNIDNQRKKRLTFVSIHRNNLPGDAFDKKAVNSLQSNYPEKKLENQELQMHLETALKRLTPKERSVFVLKQYRELKLKEIAEVLEVAEGTVKSLLFRAIKKLQKELAFYRNETGLKEKS